MTEAIFVLEGILEMAAMLRTMENHLETETNILDLCLCVYITVDHVVDCIY